MWGNILFCFGEMYQIIKIYAKLLFYNKFIEVKFWKQLGVITI